MKQDAVIDTTTLIRYASGDLAPKEVAAMAERLKHDTRARSRLDEFQRIVAHLKQVDASVDDLDFVPIVRAALTADEPRRPLRLVPAFAASLAVCLAAGLTMYLHGASPDEVHRADAQEFRAKGDESTQGERGKWTNVSAYVTDGLTKPRRLGPRMQSGEALLFSYTNKGARPFDHLLIFAVDSKGAVHWYYPAYLRPATDPVAISIEKGARNVELKEAVRHEMAPGPVSIVGLFTDEAVHVSRIEQIVSGLSADGGFPLDSSFRFPMNNCAQHIIQTKVVP